MCAREGLKVVHWHEELDASGGDSSRPKWLEAIRRVEEGETKGIVVWNLSRFSRSTLDALNAIKRIEEAGGAVYSEEGATSKLDRGLRLLIAEDERDRARASFRSATTNALQRGVYIAPKVPFGYLRDEETRRLVPHPDTAPLVVELFERRARGESWRQLSRWMTEAHGIYLAKTTLSGMLSNPAYSGVARQGDLTNENAHEAIVSRLLWDRAGAARGSKPIHTGSISEGLLLRGLVTCASCGHKMVVGNTQGRRDESGKREKLPSYYCRNAACTDPAYASGGALDAEVTSRLIGYMTWKAEERLGTAATWQIKGDESEISARIAHAEQVLEEAQYDLDAWLDNIKLLRIIGDDAWNDKAADLATTRNVAKAELDEITARAVIPETWVELQDLWLGWTMDARRVFLSQTLSDCIVEPAHRRRVPVGSRVVIRLHGPVADQRWLIAPDKWYRQYPPAPGDGLVNREQWEAEWMEVSKDQTRFEWRYSATRGKWEYRRKADGDPPTHSR